MTDYQRYVRRLRVRMALASPRVQNSPVLRAAVLRLLRSLY
jgi:hypothetical protein